MNSHDLLLESSRKRNSNDSTVGLTFRERPNVKAVRNMKWAEYRTEIAEMFFPAFLQPFALANALRFSLFENCFELTPVFSRFAKLPKDLSLEPQTQSFPKRNPRHVSTILSVYKSCKEGIIPQLQPMGFSIHSKKRKDFFNYDFEGLPLSSLSLPSNSQRSKSIFGGLSPVPC